jgi:cell division protein FtsQ
MSATTTYLPVSDDEREPPDANRQRRRLVLVILIVVVLAVTATWVVAFSTLFGVRSVTVRGAHTLTASQVEDAAAIVHGTPLIRVDTGAIVQRVEQLADVETAQASTSFPSTVVITINERTPVGYVRIGARDMLVDHTGDQYRSVRTAPPLLPKFVVPAGSDARTTGGAVATVAAALPAALLKRVQSIEALDPAAITLVLRGDRVVRWGSAARSPDKARILPALLKQPGTQFDLSDPDQPFSR